MASQAESAEAWPLLRSLTRSLVEDTSDLPGQMVAAIMSDLEFYRGNSMVSPDELRASAQSHCDYLVSAPGPGPVYDAAPERIGESRARAGVPLVDVIDAYRSGTGFLWRALVEHSRSLGTVTDAQLVDLASEVWLMHDSVVQLLERGYREEQLRSVVSAEHERFGLVYAVLTGQSDGESTLWQAVDRLNLARSGQYAVVAVQSDTVGRLPLPNIQHELMGEQVVSAWILLSDVQLGIVSAVTPAVVDMVRGVVARARVEAGISPRAAEYAHAAQALRLARIALAASTPGVLVDFADAPIAMAAAGAPDVSDQIVSSVLGRLLKESEAEREVLLGTLKAWFAQEGSTSQAARVLFVHPNTVRNRVIRIEELTGRNLARPADAADVYLALAAYSLSRRG